MWLWHWLRIGYCYCIFPPRHGRPSPRPRLSRLTGDDGFGPCSTADACSASDPEQRGSVRPLGNRRMGCGRKEFILRAGRGAFSSANMAIYSTTGRTSRANRRVDLDSREGGLSSPNEREDLASIVKDRRLGREEDTVVPPSVTRF